MYVFGNFEFLEWIASIMNVKYEQLGKKKRNDISFICAHKSLCFEKSLKYDTGGWHELFHRLAHISFFGGMVVFHSISSL